MVDKTGLYYDAFSTRSSTARSDRIKKEEEEEAKEEARKKNKFNAVNAVIDAGTAFFMSGGPANPAAYAAAGLAAISSPRGETDVVGSLTQGAAQGGIMSSLSGGGGNLYDTAVNMVNPENLSTTASYLNSMDPAKATQSLDYAGQLNTKKTQQDFENTYKQFNSTLATRRPFIDKFLASGDMAGAKKVINGMFKNNPNFESILDEIGDLPVYEDKETGQIFTVKTFIDEAGQPYHGGVSKGGQVTNLGSAYSSGANKPPPKNKDDSLSQQTQWKTEISNISFEDVKARLGASSPGMIRDADVWRKIEQFKDIVNDNKTMTVVHKQQLLKDLDEKIKELRGL